MSFLREIRRRKVFKVAAVYAVVAWLIIQVVGQISDPLNLPKWFATFVIVLLAIGFPIALILSWAFDFGAQGIRAEKPAQAAGSPQAPTAALTFVIQGLVLLAVGFLVFKQYFLRAGPGNVANPTSVLQASADNARNAMRFTVTLPEGVRFVAGEVIFQGATISPDGQSLVFTGVDASAERARLYLRPLGSLEAVPLQGTEDANSVFWSPNSRELGFFSEGKLKTISIAGGAARPIAEAHASSGASWNSSGVILASLKNPGPIYRVYLDGSAPTPVTQLDTAVETDHIWPQFLDDGVHFLYLATGRTPADNQVVVGALDSEVRIPLLRGVPTFTYAAPDSIVFFRDGVLQAQSFDSATFKLTGRPSVIADDAAPPLSASRTGAITYRTVPKAPLSMIWIQPDGTVIRPALPAGFYTDPSISPDGKQIAFARRAPTGGAYDVWILNRAGGMLRQLTNNPADDRAPHWSPDGKTIAFLSFRSEAPALYIRDASGIGAEQLILRSPGVLWPYQWPRKDDLFYFAGTSGANDLWRISPFNPGDARSLVAGPFNEADGALSPDGNWLIFSSNDTGRYELYLTRYPPDATRLQITADGAVDPTFNRDGSVLYYIRPSTGALMARSVTMSTPPEFGEPRRIHPGPFFYPDAHSFAVDPQSDDLLLAPSYGFSGDITILLNWRANSAE